MPPSPLEIKQPSLLFPSYQKQPRVISRFQTLYTHTHTHTRRRTDNIQARHPRGVIGGERSIREQHKRSSPVTVDGGRKEITAFRGLRKDINPNWKIYRGRLAGRRFVREYRWSTLSGGREEKKERRGGRGQIFVGSEEKIEKKGKLGGRARVVQCRNGKGFFLFFLEKIIREYN